MSDWRKDDPLYNDKGRVDKVLGLRETVAAKLIHAHLFTIHDLMVYLSRYKLTNIQGVGPERGGQIADALAKRRKEL